MVKISCGENSGDEILSGETGRGENIACAGKCHAAKFTAEKFPMAKFNAAKISRRKVFCSEISDSEK